ncbi:MAG: prepilin-type N-terminal cleavage/methylation domain-containing protein [Bacilli bacterium]|nr:prepilin-type N-terminal cleavage/methylation domain-containing protein [Bacilli bacterium]
MIKKGFTLIELLAVIIILAVIAVISMPIITDLITRSRFGAFGVTKKNIERAAELYFARNSDDIIWEDNISYITIGTLKDNKFLKNNIINNLNSTSVNDDTKILLYRSGRKINYALQLYDEPFFNWYQGEMIKASRDININLPTNVGDTVIVDLDTLMNDGLVDELRLPLELENRCVGYVEIEKVIDNYQYNAYVDCLTDATTFASHYVSYGGKYLDQFFDVIETSDGGYIAVGESNSEVITKYGNTGKGKYDAIIVKFKSNGTVEWSHNFGGANNDHFYKVTEAVDGYVAVGRTSSTDVDMASVNYKGGSEDSLLVKYNKQGEVVYIRSFGSSGGNGVESFNDIIKINEGYIVVGSTNATIKDGDQAGVTGLANSSEGIIIKFDENFNIIWKSYFKGSLAESFNSVKKTSDGGYIIAGHSESKDYDMNGIGWITPGYQIEGIIVKYDANGNMQYKNSFRGSRTDIFNDIEEIIDGYVVIGYSQSYDQDMEEICKSSSGTTDGIIVKYDKTLSTILWKKSFGGTNNDYFRKLIKSNNNEIVSVGYSNSEDIDMSGIAISKDGYRNSILVKYNITNGIVITKKVFGGTNTDTFNSIIKNSDNTYTVSGTTFSTDNNLKNFNKGHSDAILVNYDENLNIIKKFQEPVVIIDKLKMIVPNYGTSISQRYNNIYTSNNPEVDLKGWCSSLTVSENNSNYLNGTCLRPYNNDDMKSLMTIETASGKRVLQGEIEYRIDINPNNIYNWHRIGIHLAGSTGTIELSNLKLKFSDGYIGSISSSIGAGYIEPLVIISNSISTRTIGFFPTIMNIINDGGRTGEASYPAMYILLKPKKIKFVSLILTASRNSVNLDGLMIQELRNFDMSITPTE